MRLLRSLLILLGFTVVVVGITPVSYWLASKWALPAVERRADAIVVLGGGAGRDGLYLHSAARLLRGMQLYHRGLAPTIVFTGGGVEPDGAKEGEAFLVAWKEFGMPVTSAMVDVKAKNTYENALRVDELLKDRRKILLVTSNLHMRRARATFEKQGFKVYPSPVPPRPERLPNPAARWTAAANLVYEWTAYLKYRWEDWL